MAKYIFDNEPFSEEELLEIAEKRGVTLQELLEKNPEIKQIDTEVETEVTEEVITDPTKEGKKKPTTAEDATVVEETVAPEPTPVTEYKPADISLELPEVKTGTVADTEYIIPAVTAKESQKIIDDFNKAINVNVEFENKKATAEKINRFKKDQFKIAEKKEYNLYKETGEIQPVVLEQSDTDQKIANNRRDFMEDIAQNKRVQLLNQETEIRDSLINTTNKLTSQIKDNVTAINNIIFQYDESAKEGVPFSADEYNIARKKAEEIIKSTKQMESDLLRDFAILNKKNEFIDSFKRSYSNIDQLENVLKTSATDMALGLAIPLDMLKSEEGKEKSYAKDLLNYRQKLQKESAEGLPKAIPVESISSLKDLINWGSDSFVNFVPSGIMAFTGPIAPYIFELSGFGSRMAQFELEALEAKNQIPKLQDLYSKSNDTLEKAEIQKQIDKYNEALNVSNLKKLAVSGIYGKAERYTEMLTTVKLVKDLKSANTLFYKEGFAPAFKQAIKDIPLGGALEGGGEGLNSIIGNVADITILGEDKSAFEGVTEAAAQGFFIGNGFKVASAGSLARAYAYDVITDKQNKQEIENTLKEINNLSSAFTEDTDINTKAEAARVIRSKIKEIGLNQDFTASQFLKLSEADQRAVFEADRQSKKVNERWKKIANSNLDETSKGLIRKDLEAEFNSYQDKKISLLRKSNINTELQQPKGLEAGDFARGYKRHQVNDAAVKRNNLLNKFANKVVNVLSVEAETINDFINSDKTLLTLNDGSVVTKEEAQTISNIWENGADGGFDSGSKNQYTIIERAAANNPSTVLHEYFHAMSAAKGFTEEQFNKIKDDYEKLLKTKKESGELTEAQYNSIVKRLPIYDGKPEQAEELINITADAVNEQIIKETDFNFLQRFANNVKSIVGSIIGKDEADNFNINTAEDAWNMVQTFSKDVLSSAPQKLIIGTQPEEDDQKVKFSVSGYKTPEGRKIDGLVGGKDKDGNYIMTKAEWDAGGIKDAYDEVNKSDGLFQPTIRKGIQGDEIQGISRSEFDDNVKFKIVEILMKFNPEKNNSLSGYVNSLAFFKKGDALKEAKKTPTGRSLDTPAGETGSIREIGTADEVDMDAFMAQTDATNESNITNLKLIKEEIKTSDGKKITKLKENIEREVKEKGPKLTEKELTYKTSPDYGTPTILKAINDSFQNSTEFKKLYDAKSKQLDREIADGKTNREGQKISKANELQKFETGYILRPEDFAGSGNLSQKKFPIVKDFIDQNIKLIIENLPKAAVTRKDPVSKKIENTSTGVPNNFLNNPNLYAKTEERIGNSGIFVYEKRKGITSKDIFEMLEGKPLVKGKFGLPMQNAKQFINNLGQFATNQELRLQDFITPQQSADLEGGKDSRILFSKSMELPILNSLRVGGNQNELLSIKFSKSSKDAYEKILIGRRPELRNASEQVDNLFKWVDTLNIPENKKSKHEKLALFYMGNGNLILPEDGYKVEDAIKVAAKNKLDPFSYKNPNELLEKFAGDISPKKINPDNLSTFSNKQELADGITTYEIEDSRAGQSDVRKIIDSNWGEKANPWCLAALIDGNLNQAWDYWKRYSGKKQIAFQNNKLLAFNAFDQYNPLADPRWYDRMDKATEGLVFYKKINDPRGLKLKLELNTKNNSTKQIGYEVGSPKSNFYQEYNIDKELIAEVKRTATKEVFFNDTLKSNAVEEWKDGDEGAKFELVFYTPIENGILEEDPIDFEDADSDLRFWDKRTGINFVEPDSKKDRYGNKKSTNSKYIYESVNPKQKYIVQAKTGGEFGYIVEYKELNGVKFLTGRDVINNYVVPDKKAPPEQLEFYENLKSVSNLIGTTYDQLLREIQDTAFLLDSNNKPIIPTKFPFLTINNKGEFEAEFINEISDEIDNQSAIPPLKIKYSISFNYDFTKPDGGIQYQTQKALFIKQNEIFQEVFGSIEKQRGSVRGSHIITAKALFKGHETMPEDERAIAQKETIEIRNRAIEYKVQSGVKSLLEPGDSPYGSPQSNFGRTPKELKKSIADGTVEKENKKNVRIWNEMWKNRIYDLLESNPKMIDYIETFLELSNNDLSHPQRGGAELNAFDPNAKEEKVQIKIEGVSYNPKTNKYEEDVIKEVIKTLEYEHAKPSNIVRKELLKEAKRLIKLGKNKNFEEKAKLKEQFNEFVDNTRKNYALWAVSYGDARKLDMANLAHKMPKGETILWKRYFNKLVAKYGGIDPKKLFTIIGKEVGPSVADTFGIKNDKGELTEFGKNQLKLSKSISKAAVKNNLELPKSQRLSKDSTNEQVLAKMQELDDQANEERIKYSKSQDLDDDFNKIIEAKTGIETYKRFDRASATVKGASKGKFNFFIPPSAEDFVGLLYKTLAKGKVGDIQMQWFKDNLINPYARAMNDVSSARVAMFEDYKTLKNDLKIIPKDLKKKSFDEYTREQAVRVYIWDQQGNKIPGIFKTNQQSLVDYVNNNAELKAFADQLVAIQKGDQYSSPNEGWLAGSITTDLLDSVNSVKRKKYLEQWQTNVDEIFGESNMNKLEAAFGKPYREALTNILTRMKTGRNKPFTSDSLAGRFTNWLNNSVGAIMFFNTRSAVLQLLSSINFVNFTDNNPLKAGAAFANQPQYWKDFKFLFNSDFLKERRGGLRFNVSESEIADAAKKGGARGVVSKILQAGFLPTQMADSFAIATGGATFYRNRVKTYTKQGLTEAEANEKAFQDFRETAEESQQSSRPDRISAQQAGPLGRTILAFANTPAQYARLTKKAASDIINGRGDLKTNISKLAYYGAVQNLIFNFLQQAVFALAFGDESDEEEKKKEEKLLGVANGMADSFLRGIGIAGAIMATLKNALIKIIKEDQKARPDYAETTVIQLLGISPPVQSKAQKVRSALKSYEWNKDEMREKGFSLDNPAYLAGANVISAGFNVPLDRVVKKVDNIKNSTQDDISTLNRIMLLAGWSDWQLDIQKEKPKKSKNSRVKVRKSSSRTGKRKVTIR